ncbi:TIGR03557 family F420-dependent LLM class oxidoreductase [Actinomadura sp. HBU206391]|uniref:TIGR03557 family F420-dependent LLM class oxidoreductase n=1 Tax=Actinomadura sp. HBU206391 TaxID=2731692 RepID=UPI0016507376|nr:TIGR03557 family F420-dependent LLM class oxidoreductase [Actinomadura sp. HBU206391]MBC6459007.1 TIGR03557 family F420-dependent LLM class oxidoreductase [Actinomadura sp. HBU206391]
MTEFGYTMLCEQTPPKQLVTDLVRAEAAGFDFSVISDHYFPWLERQGHAPYAWSVLGAAAHATERIPLMTFVTCPTIRYHPAVVAQKAATMGVLSDGRFTLGVGAGENLNEHVVGKGWPSADLRHDMLAEAVEIIRDLFEGGYVNYRGEFYDVESAKLYDRPDRPVPIAMAVSGDRSVRLAGKWADALIATEPERALVEGFDEVGGRGKPKYGQIPVSYGTDAEEAKRRAHELWSWGVAGWKVMSELPAPVNFEAHARFVRPEDVAEVVPCGDDITVYVEAVRKFTDVGFTHIAFCQIGADRQNEFIAWAEAELFPALR